MSLKYWIAFTLLVVSPFKIFATNYIVSTKSNLVSKMTAAKPGDTITVTNGNYNWGAITFSNANGTATSAWIVLRAETMSGVVFIGNTFLQFGGYHIMVTGFKFANGNSGSDDVIQFRGGSGGNSPYAYYCRLNNIIIDNYNSDTTGCQLTPPAATNILNRWVTFYGRRNRMDHCTFINKFNGGPTVAVIYDSANYPIGGYSTFHLIDSNYFRGRGWQGGNQGETIRVGLGSMSNNDGYNIIEHNLFQYGNSTDPEIISNKSNLNTYRFNTFKDIDGGITMRQGRYNTINGNFIIKTTNFKVRTAQYGIRLIDKGQKVFNNYMEGLVGNYNSLTTSDCPISIYSGQAPGEGYTVPIPGYYSADSCVIAFNTIVNCYGGAGMAIGYNHPNKGVSAPFKPQGLIIANNIISMAKGQAIDIDTSSVGTPITVTENGGQNISDSLPVTFVASGNFYSAPNNLGVLNASGFTKQKLTFGNRTNGILPPPSLVSGMAVNSSDYDTLLNNVDALGTTRTIPYSVGATEVNGRGTVIVYPLDSTMVGAGTPIIPLPVSLSSFTGTTNSGAATLTWKVENEVSMKEYQLEYSNNGLDFTTVSRMLAANKAMYTFQNNASPSIKNYYRLKLINKDGSYVYSAVIVLSEPNITANVNLYPNPSKGYFNLNASNINPNSHIELIDFKGRTVKSFEINSGLTKVSIEGLSVGMCNLVLFEGKKRIAAIPFLVGR